MRIPLVDLVAQYQSLKPELDAALLGVLEGMELFLGRNVRAFEEEFATYCETSECIGVGSGTDALHLVLRALDVRSGDEVIVPAHTFFATAEAVALAGGTPVFADVDSVTRNLTAETVTPKLGPRTRALVAVHMHGQMAEMPPLVDLARRWGIHLIEDAAQAHGARSAGRAAGSAGIAGCFSFYFSKNLGAYGEAGAVTTNDSALAARLRSLRDHGSRRRYAHDEVGLNSRLDELQAAVLRVKLPYLDGWNARRRAIAARYDAALAEVPVEPPAVMEAAGHVYHHYAILAPRRDELAAYLAERGIGTGVHYPIPCHRQVAVAGDGPPPSLPVAESLADRVLSLPMYPELTEDQVDEIAGLIRAFYGERGV
jgi:dTDP-4-amino-4,6-dideoxygalactose transaminase